MSTDDLKDVNKKIVSFFRESLKIDIDNMDAKLCDLGVESIGFIALATFLFETTGKWLDISKIISDTRVSHLSSYLIQPALEKPKHQRMVKLDNWQRYVFASQLKGDPTGFVSYLIHSLWLKEHIDLSKLQMAIKETLSNHFLLNSKLIRYIDDYYFESTPIQEDFTFKGSYLFPKKDLAKLIIKIHSDRLVNIYLQRKNKQYYLIISVHHVALDGWAYTVIQEEIFRRYAGIYNRPQKNASAEIHALNRIYSASVGEQSNTYELASILEDIDPEQYNQLDFLFQGWLQSNYTCIVLKKEQIDQYAQNHGVSDFSYDVIFSFMYYQMISKLFGIRDVFFYITLSNRYLPIPGIKELAANIATALPLFLNNQNADAREFAEKIDATLKIYFKHMSYGAITRILLENNTILNASISPLRRPYCLKLTYINNTSKIIHGNDSIVAQYVDWKKSRTDICLEGRKLIFPVIHNMGSEFIIELYTRMQKGFHNVMLNDFFKVHFQYE